jgi:sterol desaturase/sphingolipid hydroxylase (fatty acid hydroxylase superfamily)
MDLTHQSIEALVRFAAFAGILIAMAGLELALPMRQRREPRARRWSTNLLIAGVGVALVRVLALVAAPLVATGAALFAEQRDLGSLNQFDGPAWLEVLAAVVVLDGLIYLQHVATHKVPLLWRLHRMHHADRDIDVTTGIRFHPIEIGLSMLYKSAAVILLGASPLAVVLFEVILNGTTMFNHTNVRLSGWLDRVLRSLIVTPDMHRIHHSVQRREHDTNHGFALSIWDRVFGTYTAEPEGGHLGMTVGLSEYQSEAPSRLGWSLGLPFQSGGNDRFRRDRSDQ